jgi:hypothetical protein
MEFRTEEREYRDMGQKVVKTLVDDFDGTQKADVTRWLAVDGKVVRLDLTAANSARLDAAVAEFMAVGAADRSGASARARRTVATAGPVQSASIREWARANGYPVSDHGRLPAAVLQGFAALHAR